MIMSQRMIVMMVELSLQMKKKKIQMKDEMMKVVKKKKKMMKMMKMRKVMIFELLRVMVQVMIQNVKDVVLIVHTD